MKMEIYLPFPEAKKTHNNAYLCPFFRINYGLYDKESYFYGS